LGASHNAHWEIQNVLSDYPILLLGLQNCMKDGVERKTK